MASLNTAKVVFLGLGLISGSLALALKRNGWVGKITAWGPRAPSLERGLALGVIDDFDLDLSQAIAGADVLVIGAPPISTGELLATLPRRLQALNATPIITDLASMKGWVIDQMPESYPRFVPGHPIAGSENSGVMAARADLFVGREAILTPDASTDPEAVKWVTAMWESVGSRVTVMSAIDHDAALAASSHSPHMLAYALTMALANDPLNPMRHGGGALRDMTRIAASDPVMWRDVALTNKGSLIDALTAVEDQLSVLKALIASGDGEELERYFAICRSVRREHDRVLNPLDPSASAQLTEDADKGRDLS
ncbi:MAG: prephenate dehydrogenase/arogenate dehydrogenase family protein [Halieaceae bacterium]|nr:prephenate dehydrogenase/arogenate dehydrogenase family protein [Halieaceae bacterium]